MTGGGFSGRRMAGDASWNFAALAVTAATGAAMTLLIASLMGTAALGVFAQLYAIHVIAAQVAVAGVHDSTQKHAAEHAAGGRTDAAIVAGGLGVVLATALPLAGVIALAAAPYGALVASTDVGRGLYLVAPGVAAFALNKVLFGAINGRGRLRLYAWMQVARAAFVLAAAVAVAGLGWPAWTVGGIFAAAELALLPCLVAAVRPSLPRETFQVGTWMRRHLSFGGRGLLNGILLETHLRVDVLTLAYFVSDRAIGVYAFAALFAEAIYQVPVVIRTVAYPTLVRLASHGERAALAHAARRLSLASGAVSAAAALAVGVGYPFVAAWIDPAFAQAGWPVLQVLLLGMVVYAFFVPFDQLLLQSGFPGRQSALMALYVATNVGLNLLLIPPLGLLGAAIATAVALGLAGLLLLGASWLWLGYRRSVLLYRTTAA
jgi:O-antigen/teichoic acid export membrane protein